MFFSFKIYPYEILRVMPRKKYPESIDRKNLEVK